MVSDFFGNFLAYTLVAAAPGSGSTFLSSCSFAVLDLGTTGGKPLPLVLATFFLDTTSDRSAFLFVLLGLGTSSGRLSIGRGCNKSSRSLASNFFACSFGSESISSDIVTVSFAPLNSFSQYH